MRVFYGKPLLRFVDGVDDWLRVKGTLTCEITPAVNEELLDLPRDVTSEFVNFMTAGEQTIDCHGLTVYMPDEFEFHVDAENLDRLGREALIRGLPGYAEVWQSGHRPIRDLKIGGGDEWLSPDDRKSLMRAMEKVWALPVSNKTFVIDRLSFNSGGAAEGLAAAIRFEDGLVEEEVSDRCDYYVTIRADARDNALWRGAKQILSILTVRVMLEGPYRS